MELTDVQIAMLQLIHDIEGHGIGRNEMSWFKEEFPNFDNDLQQFIENKLMEYEIEEDKFYLTYEGFEKIENKVISERPKTDLEQYQEIIESFGGVKQFQKIALASILLIGACVSIALYLNPEIINSNKRDNIDIEEARFNQMKIQLQEQLDSIIDAKDLERKNLPK